MSDEILIELGEVSEDTKGCPGYFVEYIVYVYEQPMSEGLPPHC